MTDPLFELISKHPESQFDLLEFRHALEGISAYYAALRGTETDYEEIKISFNQIGRETDLQATAKAINEFHFAVAEASHNVVLLHLIRGMSSLLEQSILENLTVLVEKDSVKAQLAEHRKTLFNAVIEGQPIKAREASNAHLAFIEEALLKAGKENSRIKRSLRRTQQN